VQIGVTYGKVCGLTAKVWAPPTAQTVLNVGQDGSGNASCGEQLQSIVVSDFRSGGKMMQRL
jgi:hypothetical protein